MTPLRDDGKPIIETSELTKKQALEQVYRLASQARQHGRGFDKGTVPAAFAEQIMDVCLSALGVQDPKPDPDAHELAEFSHCIPPLLHWIDTALHFNPKHLMLMHERGAYLILRKYFPKNWKRDERESFGGQRAQADFTASKQCCPKCGSTDILDASQSLDCNHCGHSW